MLQSTFLSFVTVWFAAFIPVHNWTLMSRAPWFVICSI